MHRQRIEINLRALAALSLMAIVVLSSRKKERRGFGRLRIAASDVEPEAWSAQDPCETRSIQA